MEKKELWRVCALEGNWTNDFERNIFKVIISGISYVRWLAKQYWVAYSIDFPGIFLDFLLFLSPRPPLHLISHALPHNLFGAGQSCGTNPHAWMRGKNNETRQTKGVHLSCPGEFLALQHGLFVPCNRQAAKNLQNLLQSSGLGGDQIKVFIGYSLNAHCLAPG